MDKSIDAPPTELKQLLPFVQRANELRTADRVIAYWCLYYAAQLGILASAKQKESKLFLLDLMDNLEALKSQLTDNDAVTNDTASAAYVENFALKVFVGADNEDRSGKATRATAKKFLAASQFVELLKVFGELDPDMQAKVKYAKWKAADIAKAYKEGRKPQPGPAGGDPKDEAADFENAIARGLESKQDKDEEDAYLAREMAKLTAPGPAGSTVPQAISPASPSEVDPFDGHMHSRKRATSKARMSLHMDGAGSPLPSPNFSKPLHPQLPSRSDSIGNPGATESVTPPLHPGSAGSGGGGTSQWAPSSFNAAPGVPTQDPSSRASSTGFPSLPVPPPSNPATSPSVLSGSRPLPVPPHRDGLPIPPSTSSQRGVGSGGRNSPAGVSTPRPGSTSGLPSVPVSPNFTSITASGLGGEFASGDGGAPSGQAHGFDLFQPSFPATPSAPPAPDAPETTTTPSRDSSSAPTVHYFLPPSESHPAHPAHPARPAAPPAAPTAAAFAPPAPAPAPPATKVPDLLSFKLSTRVQKLAKSAASAVDFDDLDTARKQLRQALNILEGRVTE